MTAAATMKRADLKNRVYMQIAKMLSELSTCNRLKVGAVLLGFDGSVVGTGYNGSLPGLAHCDEASCNTNQRCLRTRHAERSALDYSQARVATAYVTHEPCLRCTQDLIARGCKVLYFEVPYLINVGQKMREVDPDHWVRLMEARILNTYAQGLTDQHILITDVRQPNELEMIKRLGGAVYLVQRKDVVWNGHPTEKMATQLEHFAGRVENRLPLGSTDPELVLKSAEHFRLASYELISYEIQRQHAPTTATTELPQ